MKTSPDSRRLIASDNTATCLFVLRDLRSRSFVPPSIKALNQDNQSPLTQVIRDETSVDAAWSSACRTLGEGLSSRSADEVDCWVEDLCLLFVVVLNISCFVIADFERGPSFFCLTLRSSLSGK